MKLNVSTVIFENCLALQTAIQWALKGKNLTIEERKTLIEAHSQIKKLAEASTKISAVEDCVSLKKLAKGLNPKHFVRSVRRKGLRHIPIIRIVKTPYFDPKSKAVLGEP